MKNALRFGSEVNWSCPALLIGVIAVVATVLSPVDKVHGQNHSNAKSTTAVEWHKLESVFDQYFRQLPGHQPYFIITRADVDPLWAKLAKAGWNVRDREDVVKRLPQQGEFLVRQMRTGSGRGFMARIAPKYLEIYDRLDILANTPWGGTAAVSGIVTAKDAELTVQYMFTKAGERSWSAMLPERGAFNKPTGRIYTAESLKLVLERMFLQQHRGTFSQVNR
jgi:hypothetical protein